MKEFVKFIPLALKMLFELWKFYRKDPEALMIERGDQFRIAIQEEDNETMDSRIDYVGRLLLLRKRSKKSPTAGR